MDGYNLVVCGRYTISNPSKILPELLIEDHALDLPARYNVAPGQMAPVVAAGEDGSWRLTEMQWGLVPSWADDPGIGHRLINARAETVGEKPAFRDSLARRRCVVAADGFYEWQKGLGGKQPYLLRLAGGAPFGFAGLWDRWCGPRGQVLETFTILTTGANKLVEPIHKRMPVILDRQERAAWLVLRAELGALSLLCEPFPASAMEAIPVSGYVNNTAHDSVECLKPLALTNPRTLF